MVEFKNRKDFQIDWFKPITPKEIENFSKNIDISKGGMGMVELWEKYDVQPSFSVEGGIAIPYNQMEGLPKDFGEMLHLRFLPLDINTKEYWMKIYPNSYKPTKEWSIEEFEIIKKYINKLLKVAEMLLGRTLIPPSPKVDGILEVG